MLRVMPALSLRTVLWAGVVLILGVSAWLYASSPDAVSERAARERQVDRAGEGGDVPGLRASLTVDSHAVQLSDERFRIDVSGILEPIRRVVVAAEVPGQVVSVDVAEHAPVEQGKVLVRLDPALPEAAAMRSRAALLRAQSFDRLAQSELRRQRDLSKRGVTSEADLDRAESEARSTSAQVSEAKAALNDAETRLAKTEIRAPFAGVVSNLELDPGTYLQPGQTVVEIADLSEIEIEVGVSGRDRLGLAVGDRVEVRVQALPGESFEGRIASLGPTADAITRKYPVPVVIDNGDEKLLAGMLGTLRFELGDERRTLIVPRRAVRSEFDLQYLFVLEPRGESRAVTRRRRVETRALPFRPEVLEVTQGLEPGERIATTGVRELREGQLVRVRASSPSPDGSSTGS